MNTVKQGKYRWMIFKEEGSWVGVALEFNIVITGEDPKLVELELQESVIGYLESAKKLKGFRVEQVNSILNQSADKEYEDRWTAATSVTVPSDNVISPFSDIYKAGVGNLANV